MSSADSPLGWSLVKKDVLHPTADDSCRSRGSVCNAVQCWFGEALQTQAHPQLEMRHCPVDLAGMRHPVLPLQKQTVKKETCKSSPVKTQAASFSQHKMTSSGMLCKIESPQKPKNLNTNQHCSGAHSDTQLLSQTMHRRTEVALMSSLSQLVPSSSAALP